MIETNQVETVWVEFPPDPSLPKIPPGISSITYVHHWIANTATGEWGVRQYRRGDDNCTLLLGQQSVHIPMSAPKLAATVTSLLLAVVFLLVVGAKLFKQIKRA